MARPVVVATRNRGKLTELHQLLRSTGVELLTLDDAAARLGRTLPEVVEDGETFAANAAKKAREIAAATGWPALADDSGLEVDALDGAPGVHSARWAGCHGDDAANNAHLLAALTAVSPAQRTARFRCALAFADSSGRLGTALLTADGTVEGIILTAPDGDGGFGYDPLFFCPELGRTFAAAGRDAKNQVSHRSRAMTKLAPQLVAYLSAADADGPARPGQA